MRVATVVGARPQFIKMAPLSRELRKYFEEIVIHTGQHYDYEMDRIFFEQLNIPPPDYNLGVGSGFHGYQTGEMLKRIEDVLIKESPDLVIVYGDTNSTLAGALAAAKLRIRVAHVEAGLRCFDRTVPEEVNRVLTDHISDLLFVPTERAVKNLYNEGIKNGVYLTGDVMLDALLHNITIAEKESKIIQELGVEAKSYLLVTVHRAENTDNRARLENIIECLVKCKRKTIFPIHPRTKAFLEKYSLLDKLKNADHIILTKPLSYFDMLVLEKNARQIITDSGGVQKEAYSFKTPCITLRKVTEWPETVEDGLNILVGDDYDLLLDMIWKFEPVGGTYSFRFGHGDASSRVVQIMKNILCA
ncbi:MAG: non-hydrolyzing UDP-N-acetylglucosamine 2-epimerase [Candidatus Methanosuratincola verstraetei]